MNCFGVGREEGDTQNLKWIGQVELLFPQFCQFRQVTWYLRWYLTSDWRSMDVKTDLIVKTDGQRQKEVSKGQNTHFMILNDSRKGWHNYSGSSKCPTDSNVVNVNDGKRQKTRVGKLRPLSNVDFYDGSGWTTTKLWPWKRGVRQIKGRTHPTTGSETDGYTWRHGEVTFICCL